MAQYGGTACGTFHGKKIHLAAEKARAGQGHAVVCPTLTGKAKERMPPKQERASSAGSLTLGD